jgi:hypothetical protein
MAGLGSSCSRVPLSFLFSPSSYRLRPSYCLYPSFNTLYFCSPRYVPPPLSLTLSLLTYLIDFTKPLNPEKLHNTKPYHAFPTHLSLLIHDALLIAILPRNTDTKRMFALSYVTLYLC